MLDDLSTGRIENLQAVQGHPRFTLTVGSVAGRGARPEAGRLGRRRLSPGGGGRRAADPRAAGRDHRDQHRRDRDGAAGGRRSPDAAVVIASTSEVYGKNDRVPLERGRRPGARAHDQEPLELRVLQGDRRVPRARLPPRARASRWSSSGSSTRWGRGRRAATAWSCRGSSARRSTASRSRSTATAGSRAASPTWRTRCGRRIALSSRTRRPGRGGQRRQLAAR